MNPGENDLNETISRLVASSAVEESDADVADIDLTISSLMGGPNMAVLQRWALTGEVDPDDMSQHAVTLFLNGVRAR